MKYRIRKDDIAVYTNPLIDQMLDRRSYREFTDRKVEEEKIQALLEVARHTATSIGLQWASLIRIKDPRKKEALADYDEEIQTYYDLRDANRRVDCFTDQVVKKIGTMNPDRNRLTRVAKRQGFRLYEDGPDFPPKAD